MRDWNRFQVPHVENSKQPDGKPLGRVKAALVDVDGTLIDSNDAHANAWVETLAEFGFQASFERVRDLIGKGGDKLLPETTGVDSDSPLGKKISARRSQLFLEKYVPTLRPFRGARDLLARMQESGLIVVIATSAQATELKPLLAIVGAEGLIDDKTTSDDAENSKPDPDIVEAALKRAGCDANEAVMLGDTPYDIEAARRAGVPTIALRSGGWDDAALAGASAIYEDAADLLANFEGSPFVLPHNRGDRARTEM